jgi:hypothetical protein
MASPVIFMRETYADATVVLPAGKYFQVTTAIAEKMKASGAADIVSRESVPKHVKIKRLTAPDPQDEHKGVLPTPHELAESDDEDDGEGASK